MRKWSRKSGITGVKVKATMEAHEVEVMAGLVRNLLQLLDERASIGADDELAKITGMSFGTAEPPEDPILRRLLPDFRSPAPEPDGSTTPADMEITAEIDRDNHAMRSLHEPEILQAKRSAARVVLETLPVKAGSISLRPQEADAWLRCLADVRIALATVIGIDESTPDEIPADHPRAGQFEVYHWVTLIQDSLVEALMG